MCGSKNHNCDEQDDETEHVEVEFLFHGFLVNWRNHLSAGWFFLLVLFFLPQ